MVAGGGHVQWRYASRGTLVIPEPLSPGDTIAVVAPSSPLSHDELWRGLAWLRARYGLRVRPSVFARDGYLAGADERRGAELASAMLDEQVKAVLVARGGYGVMRILDELPWRAFAHRPKWIVGFSDATALHATAWRLGIASVHAPNATGLGRDPSVATRIAWLLSLERPTSMRAWRCLRVVRSGAASGPIVGGNLSLLHAMAAAGRLTMPRAAVLAIEDVGEPPYRIDRMLTSLILGGHLAEVSAVVFGGFARCPPAADGRSVDEVLDLCTRPLGIPVLCGAPFGHGEHNEAFVLGAGVRVHADEVIWSPVDEALV
jgi:muramoyltetrapeptide carboxypeptidase